MRCKQVRRVKIIEIIICTPICCFFYNVVLDQTGVVLLWQKPTAVFDFNLHLVMIGDFVYSKISLAINRGKIKNITVLPKNDICNNKIWSC